MNKIAIMFLMLASASVFAKDTSKRVPTSANNTLVVSVGESVPTLRVASETLDGCEKRLLELKSKLAGKAKILDESPCSSYSDEPEKSAALGNKPYSGSIIFY